MRYFGKFLPAILLVSFIGAGSFAATLDSDLISEMNNIQPGQTVQALAYMTQQADLQSLDLELKAKRATLAERNRRVILALQEIASETQPEMVAYLEALKAQGSIVDYEMYWIANMFRVEATAEGLNSLAERDDIADIYYDYRIENIEPLKSKTAGNVIAGHEIGLDRINAPAVWAQGWTGAGRVVMNIDTGVDGYHDALASRFRGDVDGDGDFDESWFDPYTGWTYPQDSYYHGTHTMGTICGRTPGGDTIGVAIDAEWIASAAIDRNGIEQTVTDAIASFQWAVDPDGNPNTQDNPDAIGNSWGLMTSHGYPPCDQTFWTVIDNVEYAGSVVIFSAGNEGSSGLRRPADRGTTPYNCFAVGAVDGNNPSLPIASFSSRGPTDCGPNGETVIKPEVVAPGVDVRSASPGNGYRILSGTSMASPHITGSVAIIRQVNPNLDVDAVKEILYETAVDLGTPGEDNDYGNGIINLVDAVALASSGFGYIDGHISDANNSDPIPALVELVGENRTVQANSSGDYFMSTAADSVPYTLRASYFGYLPQDQPVQVNQGDTTTVNFLLSPAPSAVLQGTVTSLTGDSVGNAEITIAGTPLLPETTDTQGFYQFSALPSGMAYLVTAKAIGYSSESDSILIQYGQTNVLDFSLQPAESFESSNGGFSGTGEWEWGIPVQGPPGAWSGVRLWGTDLDANYDDNQDCFLYSIDYAITSPIARLEFYHWYSTESNYDGGNVSISTNGGASWTLLTPDGGYTNNSLPGLDNEPGYDGASDWTQAAFDISSYNGDNVRFRWRFGSDVSVNDDGWFIDDVVVVGSIPPEPPDMAYDPLFYNINVSPGDTETRDLHIHNNGNGALFFSLNATTDLPALNRNLKINSLKTDIDREPIGYFTENNPKGDSKEEPIFSPVITGHGGPDIFGHTWIDSDEPGGPAVNWIDISSIGTEISPGEDSYVSVPTGFSFPFYENNYSTLFVTSNGLLTFGSGSNDYSNDPIPNGSTPDNFIAPWWDDLSPQYGHVYYYQDGTNNRFIVSFVGVPNWSYGGNLNFQAVLYTDGNIEFNYDTMDPGSDQLNLATIGLENVDASDGLEIVYNADYMHSNMSIRISSGSWLSVSPNSGMINPGDSANVTVTFNASDLSEGTYTGNINLDTNDPQNPQVDIAVTLNVGTGGTAEILLTPSDITETLESGQSTVDSIKVKNTGTGILTVAFTENAGWLTIPSGPFNIAPGDSSFYQLTINASGLLAGTHIDTVITSTNAPANPTIIVPVTLNVLAADIDVPVESISESLPEGNQTEVDMTIRNLGGAALDLNLQAQENTLMGNQGGAKISAAGNRSVISPLRLTKENGLPTISNVWLFIDPASDIIAPGDSLVAQVSLNAGTLSPGTYTGQINLSSNDPADPVVVVPVSLQVTQVGGGCSYVIGDVNGSDSYNGLDVTYSVAFFKGGPAPMFECECTPGNSWYVSGDVNNSCSFNGLDVTYGVAYFKGGPGPEPCQDCPPSPAASSISKNIPVDSMKQLDKRSNKAEQK